MANQLGAIKHIVQLMLENRSFDQMLGFLYDGNKSPTTGQPFEGLTGNESNPDDSGREVGVYKIEKSAPHPYLMPGADPGEGFQHTNYQLFSTDDPEQGAVPTNKGFLIDFKAAIASDLARGFKDTLPDTDASEIMGMYSPEMLPIMSNSRKGVCCLRSLVRVGPDPDIAEPGVCSGSNLAWVFAKCARQVLYLPQHLWAAVEEQYRLGDLRLQQRTDDTHGFS